jgi:uncharacterized sporulation protein YeaH/YhbH (DUF444 family)
MMHAPKKPASYVPSTFSAYGGENGRRWYDLFSRGARDWLRHNEKIRQAVKEKLPEVISGADILGSGDRTVQVPVRFMEHFRFRLRQTDEQKGAGQGEAKPGDKLGRPKQGKSESGKEAGGNGEGGYQFVLELQVDDIIDWLWEELKLPNLEAKSGAAQEEEYVREGWNRRGARSRLDRRRSMKESIKRRAVDKTGPVFIDDDLRFRQLVQRKQPATRAVVFFAMGVYSSMRVSDRQLAKTFFFWVIQGLRRQYHHIEPVFVAHTVKAWEFAESEFFQVRGSGGTVASTAFNMVGEIIDSRYDPSQYNIYLFYASDGENFRDDHDKAEASLRQIGSIANYLGYVETPASADRALDTETAKIFDAVTASGAAASNFALTTNDSVWEAIRGFFQEQATETSV